MRPLCSVASGQQRRRWGPALAQDRGPPAWAQAGIRLCPGTPLSYDCSANFTCFGLLGAAPTLSVPLLGEAKIAEELRVHALDRAALTLAQGINLLDTVAVVLVRLVVRGVVGGLGHCCEYSRPGREEVQRGDDAWSRRV